MTFNLGQELGLGAYILINDKNMGAKVLAGLAIVKGINDIANLGILKA